MKSFHTILQRTSVFVSFLLFSFLISDFIMNDAVFAQSVKTAKANYSLASQFTEARLDKMVFDTALEPHWLENSEKFWYSFETSEGTDFYLVDPVRKIKTYIFDKAKMAALLTEHTKNPYDPKHIPITTLTFVNNDRAVRFEVDSLLFEYTLSTEQLAFIEEVKPEEKTPGWVSFSPDSLTIVFARNHNLYMMNANDPDSVEIQLTFDGERFYSYAADNSDTTTDKRVRAFVEWSPDSKKFWLCRYDVRNVNDLWVIDALAQPRPKLETYKYALPGEENITQSHLIVFDRESRKAVNINADKWKDQSFSSYGSRANLVSWGESSDKLFFGRISRDSHRLDVCAADTETGDVDVLIEDRMNVAMEPVPVHVINDGKELIHRSERDGWGHFYLYDDKGNLKNRITEGAYVAVEAVKIDTSARVLYFRACGREKGEDPYYFHLYRVNFDGSGLQLLNPENATHHMYMSPSNKYFVDGYSRVDMAPKIVLRDNRGNVVMELEEADLSVLMASGYKFPEPFKAKAADGITDIYGVMWKPFDFDPQKKYPIITWVYPGPQTEHVPKAFPIVEKNIGIYDQYHHRASIKHVTLSQFGFIVVAFGNRGGHPDRSEWYQRYGYWNLRDYGLADKKAVLEQLAARNSFIDINKVGIFGHSGGGFMSTAAMLVYPDFFKVAVSSSGNHDNNIYNVWWGEKHHGVKEVVDEDGNVTFESNIPTNQELAKNLKGHLMLVTGDIDNNVHPGGTLRMADALIKANKRFDLFIFPGKRHSYFSMEPYLFWLTADYFCKHLIGDFESSTDIRYISESIK